VSQVPRPITILLADDDSDDRILCENALKEIHSGSKLHFVEDGEELLQYLERSGKYINEADSPRPDLILLDLNMPKKDGRAALKEIKSDPNFRRIPIVVFTTSNADSDVCATYDLGVNSFITKPITFNGLVEVMNALSKYWFGVVELPD
jgi:CheY-like chemotaxis protein